MAVFKTMGDLLDYTPGSAVLGGAVVVQGNDVLSVVVSDIAAADTGEAYIKGIFEFDCSEDIAIGLNAFWDSSAEEITSTDTDIYAGRVTKATASAKIEVSINFKHEVTGS